MNGKRLLLLLLLLCAVLVGCMKQSGEEYELDNNRIREDTFYLCNEIGIRVTGTEEERQTADWIMNSLRENGFKDEVNLFREQFEGLDQLSSENIIAVCNGDDDGPLFSIVAHYDSVPTSPGARDNAASVAALLEIARFLGTENDGFSCQIRLVFLGSEENGYHGSVAYVEALTTEEKSRHIGAFNMDISAASDSEEAQLVCNTLGADTEEGYREGNFIVPAEGILTDALRQAYQELYRKELGGVFHFGESDHLSFHNAQLEAINVCWRRVSGGMPLLPESYHRMDDTPDEIDFETVRASARCILRAIRLLSE